MANRLICTSFLGRLRPRNKDKPIDQLGVFLRLDDPSGEHFLELLLPKHSRL